MPRAVDFTRDERRALLEACSNVDGRTASRGLRSACDKLLQAEAEAQREFDELTARWAAKRGIRVVQPSEVR